MKKKLLAIIAAMAMVVAMVPSMVFADSTDDVAQIGSQGYPSLQAAIDAADSGDEVKLLTDIEFDFADAVKTNESSYDVLIKVEDKSIKFNMNGKTIFVNHDDTVNRIYAVVYVADGASLEVFGDGKIDVNCNETTPKVAYTFWKRGTTGTLVINDGTYHMNASEDSIVYTNGSEIVTVKGGKFTLDSIGKGENGSPWIFNAKERNENHIIVTGGTFNADVNHQYWVFEVQAPKDKALKDNGDGTWTVVPAEAYVDEWYYDKYCKEVGYATLEEAVKAANTRGTDKTTNKAKITLLKDCQISNTLHFVKKTEIELNDKKIIWEGKEDTPIVSLDEGVTLNEFEPSREGYEFKGWYTDANYENEWNWDFESLNSQTRATQEVINLYAKWEDDPAEPTIPGGEAAPDDTAVPEEPAEEPADEVDTGDNMNMAIPFGIAGLALVAMAAVVATRRRAN